MSERNQGVYTRIAKAQSAEDIHHLLSLEGDDIQTLLRQACIDDAPVEMCTNLVRLHVFPACKLLREAVLNLENGKTFEALYDCIGTLIDQNELDELFLLACAARTDDTVVRYLVNKGANVRATMPMDIYPRVDPYQFEWEDDEDDEDENEEFVDDTSVRQNAIVVAIYENPKPSRMVGYLISLGVPVNEPDSEGYVPLLHALDDEEIVHALIAGNAEVNVTDPQGNTALMLACESENVASAIGLIEAGANVFTLSKQGYSALHFALMCHVQDNTEVVRALLKAGADPNLADKEGFTPLKLAMLNCALQSVIEVLKEGGAEYRD